MSRTFKTYDSALAWAESTGMKYRLVVNDYGVFVWCW